VNLATLRKLTLYQVGEGEHVSYRIPAIVVTAKGTVLAFCTSYDLPASGAGGAGGAGGSATAGWRRRRRR
jgi:hypothetical protein